VERLPKTRMVSTMDLRLKTQIQSIISQLGVIIPRDMARCTPLEISLTKMILQSHTTTRLMTSQLEFILKLMQKLKSKTLCSRWPRLEKQILIGNKSILKRFFSQ